MLVKNVKYDFRVIMIIQEREKERVYVKGVDVGVPRSLVSMHASPPPPSSAEYTHTYIYTYKYSFTNWLNYVLKDARIACCSIQNKAQEEKKA